jgi:agmatine deiminase
MKKLFFLLPAILFLIPLLSGCAGDNSTEYGDYQLKLLETAGNDMLPAYQTEAEKIATSQGAGYSYRLTHPNEFRVTLPPNGSVVKPGEFEPVKYFYVTYMGMQTDFILSMVEAAYDQVQVRIVTPNDTFKSQCTQKLKARNVPIEKIEFVMEDVNSIWMRDYGPIAILANGKQAYVDMKYYPPRVYDDAIPTKLAENDKVDVYRPDIFSEGGNYFADGTGNCFTSEYTLQQNPGKSKAAITKMYHDYFGCEQVHYIKELTGNVIYHIDMFFYVADSETLLLGQYTKEQDPWNYDILEANYQYLSSLKNGNGKPYKIVRVTMPDVITPKGGLSVVRTYLNLLAVNGVVLVPTYIQNPGKEAEALSQIQTAFPDRKLIKIPADSIAWEYGSVHCTTQTIPAM